MSIENTPFEPGEMEMQSSPEQVEDLNLLDETYSNSSVLQKYAAQEQRGEAFTAGFTDIDNTFFRSDRALESKRLAEQAETHQYPLICVTGNDYGGVMSRINSGELPKFDILIGSVGTEIWVLQSETGEYKKDQLFERSLAESGYNRVSVAEQASKFLDLVALQMSNTQLQYQHSESELNFLQTGDMEAVQPFKLSFHFFAESEEELSVFTRLAASHFPSQELVICEEINHNRQLKPEDTRKKYCLDIVPITKAGAVRYVSDLISVKKGIVAGDSGNDTDMLVNSGGLAAIIVGGAKSELLGAVSEKVDEQGRASFTKVVDENGEIKAYYVERKESRLGPDSIAHAAEVLLRAERIKRIRLAANSNQST